MLEHLISNARHLGTIYLGRIKSWEDLDSIGTRLGTGTHVIFANSVTFKDITSLMEFTEISKAGVFNKPEHRAVDYIIDIAFRRGNKDYYVIHKSTIPVTIVLPETNPSPERCLLIEDKK